ncbi:hypothetical protein [Streptomyces harbinensis]|uniref:hypothetical protein n=1 Tax=Streptomyces harbinensis TaxID=1176198 RepID=UPI00368C3FE2
MSATSDLAALRAELHRLVALADASVKPAPTRINGAGHPIPGYEWQVADDRGGLGRWLVRTADGDEDHCVYVHTPAHGGDDVIAIPREAARQLAMALLAAADRAHATATGIRDIAPTA